MNETVTISISRFAELVRKEERIEAVARLFENNEYTDRDEIRAVLGIERREKKDV